MRSPATRMRCAATLMLAFLFTPAGAPGQTFTALRPDPGVSFFPLFAWIDYDLDGDLDLYVGRWGGIPVDTSLARNKLFRNDGGDTFSEILTGAVSGSHSQTVAATAADYDNDGDLDLYESNWNVFLDPAYPVGSVLYQNTGGDLEPLHTGALGDTNTVPARAGAWGDYDNDGFADIVLPTNAAATYPGEDTLGVLIYHNEGDGTFALNETDPVALRPPDAYSPMTWSDFDQDGDLDMFMGSSPPGGGPEKDFFYVNQLVESGTAAFLRDTTSAYASVARDASRPEWVDYDNDGDLDLYILNRGAGTGSPPTGPGMANELWRCDGAGVYHAVTAGPIVTELKISRGQSWNDYDNDGDLDVYVVNGTSAANFGGNSFYRNEGPPSYEFASIPSGNIVKTNRNSSNVATADYDDDGDVDMYVSIHSVAAAPRRDILFRNDEPGGNHWIKFRCVGAKTTIGTTGSNRSALGAKVRVKATIFGNAVWQMREIASRDGWADHGDLRAHFGLGDAAAIDSLVVEWPSGIVDVFTGLAADSIHTIVESVLTGVGDGGGAPAPFRLGRNVPNPFNPATTIRYSIDTPARAELRVYGASGRQVRTLARGRHEAGAYAVVWDGTDDEGRAVASGVYFYRLAAGDRAETRKMLLVR